VELAFDVAAFEPDAVVVAGDMAESLHDFETCLVVLKQRVQCPVWVLPGNHDLWVRHTGSSERLFAEELQR
jgi:3',5'-cyclic AMP phosphodiesterase CpdA